MKQRTVLAVLAVDTGRLVSWSELVDRVWDQAPAGDARQVLYTYASRIRRVLAAAGAAGDVASARLVRRPGGYLLQLDPDDVDAHRFRRLVGAAADRRCADADRVRLLREALALWQGSPLADLPGDWAAATRLNWQPQRVEAALAWAEAQLRLGNAVEVIGPVRDLLAEHPLTEPLTAALIRALAVAGRPAEALHCYATVRAQLADELGTEPGPELRSVHQALLAGTDLPSPVPIAGPGPGSAAEPSWPAPAQLPRDVAGFTGRRRELAALDQLLAPRRQEVAGAAPTAVVITAVSGTAGVGKTALAIHWAHRAADQFPDGQLHVNLRGFDPGGQVVAPAAAVRGFLDALGVPKERVPVDLDAQAALYRSLLVGRRVLVVIDNARDAEHVRPLLPGTPPAVAVVTSRDPLVGLVAADGAHPLMLDLLTDQEAWDLLARRLGDGRIAAEPDAVERITAGCARLPLALALVAARAATHHTARLTELASELPAAGDHTGHLDAGDILTRVQAVFSWSYTTLTPPAARLFRLLGLHPGPDTTAPAAASLTGLPVARVRGLLAGLVRAGLLAEPVPGRYGFHDLLRAYATQLADSVDSGQQRGAATLRLLDHYIHTAHTADRHLDSGRDAIPIPLSPPAPGTTPEPLANQRAALEWLDAELPVLLPAQRRAAGGGRDTHAWQLAWALTTVLHRRGRWREMAGAWQATLPAAGRLPHPAAGYAHRLLGQAVSTLGDDEQALTHLHHALDQFTEAGDPVGQAAIRLTLGGLCQRRGQPDQALDHAQQALTLYRAAGHRRGQAIALNNAGWYHTVLGNHTKALTCCQQALTLNQQLGDRVGEANVSDSLGYAHHHLAHFTQATDCYQRALTLARDLDDRHHEATILTHLGDTHHAAGHPDQARTAWTTALHILTDLDHPDAKAVRAKLALLSPPSPTPPGTSPTV